MDTPIIAQYYRETEPEKRKELLEQAIASGEDQEANKIRKEIWEARYKGTTNEGGIADGYLKFWMALEFNRNAGHKVFGSGRAQKEIRKELDDVKSVSYTHLDVYKRQHEWSESRTDGNQDRK